VVSCLQVKNSRCDHMRAICNTAVPLLMPCNYYPPPKPQAALPPLVACPRLNIQYIRSYLPHLKAVFAIGNIVSYAIGTGTHLKRTRHVVMKNNQLQLDVKSNGARGGLKKGGGHQETVKRDPLYKNASRSVTRYPLQKRRIMP